MAIDYANLLAGGLSAALQSKANSAYNNEYNNLNNLLKQTYSDPTSVYNSQYKAMDNVFYNKLQRQAAAEGRSTDVSKMGTAREAAFQNYLNQYRNSLSSQLNQAANAQKINSTTNKYTPYTTVLGQLLAPSVGKDGKQTASPLNDSINSAIGKGIDYIGGLFSGGDNSAAQPTQVADQNTYDYTGNLGNWWNQDWWNNTNNTDTTYSGDTSPVWNFSTAGTGA